MEAVIDKLMSELDTFTETTAAQGGCSDIIDIQAIYFGDPGVIPVHLYPCFLVVPLNDTPVGETTGYEVRNLNVQITLMLDVREYFDATVDEATGDRKLVQSMENLRRWLRRTSNRQLDGLAGVREVAISETDYLVQVRGAVIAKSAQLALTVQKQFQRQA